MTRSLNSLSLFTGEPSSSSDDLATHEPRAHEFRENKLWIAVQLPDIALESHPDCAPNEITVVVEPRDGRHRVVAANRRALERGIKPEIKLAAAYALSDALRVLKRCPEAERSVLEAIARWARRLTPAVSLVPPQELLLEVQGSLKLFGGLRAIKKTLQTEFERRRIRARLCAAPTALAALWLVRHGSDDIRSPEKLAGSVGMLPLRVTGWPERTQATLQSMGLRTIGDCMRLPRDGFIRRIGREYLLQLDRSLGGYDSRPEFQSAQRFSSRLEFIDEITDPAVLSHAGESLIENLVEILRKRQAGVASFDVVFQHLNRPATIERINLAGPAQDQERFSRLFLDRLEHIILPAPVVALALRTGRAEVVVAGNAALFHDVARPQAIDTMDRLIERLRGRFGAARIFGMSLVEEHRPEAAWGKSLDLSEKKRGRTVPNSPWAHHRPLWLLPNPIRLTAALSEGHLCHGHEIVQPKSGPERIEAGWWSGKKISRDYYTALNSKGEKLWIYQDRYADQNWYLHGIFG